MRWRIAASLPPVFLALAVAVWGVDVPYWDQWAMVPMIGQLFDGNLEFASLWSQLNDHRVFFPRLLMLALAWPSRWNIRWELAANVFLAVGLFVVICHWLRQTAGPRAVAVTFFLASMLIFNLNQWENWAWGLQLLVTVHVAAMVFGLRLLALENRRLAHLLVAAGLGVIATFSFANGLLFWPLSLPLVLLPEGRRWRRGILWGLFSMAVVALFFQDYTFGAAGSFRVETWWDLVEFGAFVCVYLGAPLSAFDGKLAFVGGVVAIVIFSAWVLAVPPWPWTRGPRLSPNTVMRIGAPLGWVTLAGYGISSGLLAAFGRLEQGVPMALSSRYIVFSNCFWLGLLGLAVLRLPSVLETRIYSIAPLLRRVAVSLMTILLIAGSLWGGALFHQQHQDRIGAATILSRRALDENDPTLYPGNQIPLDQIETLRRHRLSLFR